MAREQYEEFVIRKVKVRLRPETWRRVQLMAAYLGLHIQDLAGYLIYMGITPVWRARLKELKEPGGEGAAILQNLRTAIREHSKEV